MIARVDNNRSGTVLIVVLVLVMLMSVAAYGYLLAMQTENIAAKASGDELITQQAAFSARDWLAVLLEQPRSQRAILSSGPASPGQFGGVAIDELADRQADDLARAAIISPEALTIQDGTRFGGMNESAKLHLMKLTEWDELDPGSGRTALMHLPGMDEATADAILDWIDADSEPRFEGGEADVYRSLGGPRNGRPLDLDELLLVRGVDPLRLFGTGMKLGEQDDANRVAANVGRDVMDNTIPQWSKFLTVYSAERNEARDGTQRIDLNDDRLDVLHQRLSERMPVEWANFIILFRQYGPGDASGDAADASRITVDYSIDATYEIESPLDLIDASVSVPRGDDESESVASPFRGEIQTMQTQIPQLMDQTTANPAPRIEGRINVNFASREVLLAIPALDEGLVERILAARAISNGEMTNRDHDAWLLTEGIVDIATMRTLLPHITAGGDVYRAEFWGYLHDKAPSFGFEAVVDATEKVAHQVYFRKLERAQLMWTEDQPSGDEVGPRGSSAPSAGREN